MNAVDFWMTFFEAAAIVLLIVGFINEKKVAAFERKLAIAIRCHWNTYKARRNRHLDDPERLAREVESQFDAPKVEVLDTWRNQKYKEG